MRKEIEDLLNDKDSEGNYIQSAYAISKGSGVSSSVILDLRNKKRKLDNISLLNAERLYYFYVDQNK